MCPHVPCFLVVFKTLSTESMNLEAQQSMKSSIPWAWSLIGHSAFAWMSPGEDMSPPQQRSLLGLQSLKYLNVLYPEPAKAPSSLYLRRQKAGSLFSVYTAYSEPSTWLSSPSFVLVDIAWGNCVLLLGKTSRLLSAVRNTLGCFNCRVSEPGPSAGKGSQREKAKEGSEPQWGRGKGVCL